MIARGRHAFVVIVVTAVVAAVVGGLFVLGSPRKARERELDARRAADVQGIASAVDLYWTRQGRLPASLDDLSRAPGLSVSRVDPATQRPYEYRVLEGTRYELCAVFASEGSDGRPFPAGDFWAHGAGRQCFRLEPRTIKH